MWRPRTPSRRPWRWTGIALAATLFVFAAVRFLDVKHTLASGKFEAAPVAGPVKTPAPVSIPASLSAPKESAEEIWPVEQTAAFETYSNGLRIDNRFATGNHPRSYLAFAATHSSSAAQRRTTPAGIVFHTTESLQAPFEPDQNGKLVQVGEALTEFVKRK